MPGAVCILRVVHMDSRAYSNHPNKSAIAILTMLSQC